MFVILNKFIKYIQQKLTVNYLLNYTLNYITGGPFSIFITTLRYYFKVRDLKSALKLLFIFIYLCFCVFFLIPFLADLVLIDTAFASSGGKDGVPNLADKKAALLVPIVEKALDFADKHPECFKGLKIEEKDGNILIDLKNDCGRF